MKMFIHAFSFVFFRLFCFQPDTAKSPEILPLLQHSTPGVTTGNDAKERIFPQSSSRRQEKKKGSDKQRRPKKYGQHDKKSPKSYLPPIKDTTSKPISKDGSSDVYQKANLKDKTKLPRIASAKPREVNEKNNSATEKNAIIVNSPTNVSIGGQQTILSSDQNGKKKQIKFLNDYKSRREILEEETRICLQNLKAGQSFIKTRAYITAKDIVHRNKFLLIKSKPGDGGSFMAMKLLNDFTESSDQIIPLRILEVKDFDEAIGGTNCVILIDGLFDLNNATTREFRKEWIEKLQRLATALRVNRRNNLVIITMGEEAYQNLPRTLRDSQLFQSALIDISHECHNLTLQEKKDFLNDYVVPYCDLTDSQAEELINSSLPFGYPKCCDMFSSDCTLHRDPLLFFRDPHDFIQSLLETIEQEDPSRLAPLALVVLDNGTLSEKQLYNISSKKNDALWTTIENHYESLLCERKDLKSLVSRAKGIFLQFDRNTSQYTFIHPAVQKGMVCFLGNMDLKPVIKHCELSNLPQLRTRSDPHQSFYVCTLEKRCFERLSKKIRKAMFRRDSFQAVSTMSVWEEEEFIDYFINFLKDNNDEDFFLLQDASMKGVIEYAMDSNYPGATKNMIFIAGKAGQDKLLLDQCCAQNSPLATVLLNKIKPDIKTIQVGLKSRNASMIRVILSHMGKNFDYYAQTHSTLADDFSIVTIAEEACLSGDVEVVDIIIEHFPDLVSSKEEPRFLKLLKAAMTVGNPQIIDKIVETGVDEQDGTQKNSVVFSIACKNNEMGVAEYFGTNDVGLFTSRDKNNYTPLHFAAVKGSREMADYLIRGGTDPFALTMKQATALHLSCASGNADIAAFLINQYPTLMEMEDNKKATPVHYAARGESVEILNLLVKRHVDLGKVTTENETVLHVSCHTGSLEISKLLASKCPELSSAVTKKGFTALHFACKTDKLDLVRFLVEDLQLDPLKKTKDGMNSVQLASENEIKKYLQRVCVSNSFPCEN